MNLQEEYKQKIENAMKPSKDRLVELRAEADRYMMEANLKYTQHIEELNSIAKTLMEKITELGNVNSDSWEALKDGVEGALEKLNNAIEETTKRFALKDVKRGEIS